jgi:hypothetical protein
MLNPSNAHTIFVYDPEDGSIIHIHKEFVLEGAAEPQHSEMQDRARSMAGRSGRDVTRLRLLSAEDSRTRGKKYKIDPTTESLVAVD